jgi:hypothetical protein
VFRVPENSDTSYPQPVTTPTEVQIAGVPWPVHKLAALAVGLVVFMIVGLATMTLGPAIVAAATVGTVVGLVLRLFRPPHH